MDLHAMMLAVTVILEKKGRSFERLLLAPILRRSLGLQKIAADGEGTIVCFDYRENRKTPLPAELRRKISELENSVAPVKA